jgi:hypothetical protein
MTQAPTSRAARIIGTVEYREGDGANKVIRPGPVEVTITAADATLSWVDGQTRGSAAMPLSDYHGYVVRGLITLGA